MRQMRNGRAAVGKAEGFELTLLLASVLVAFTLGAVAVPLAGRLAAGVKRRSMPTAQGILAKGRARASSTAWSKGPDHPLVVTSSGFDRTWEARHPVNDHGEPEPVSVQRTEVANPTAAPPSSATLANWQNGDDVRALGYVSVTGPKTPAERALQEQIAAIAALCHRRGWRLSNVARDVADTRATGMSRPGLFYALKRLAHGEVSCLIVAELGRLSGSAADLARLLRWMRRRELRLVAVDVELDTGSPEGRLAADALISVGELERGRHARHTSKGVARTGPRDAPLSRPAVRHLPALRKHIAAMRSAGMTLQAIADRLNAQGVPTLRGGEKWRPSSVQAAAGYRRPRQASRATERGDAPRYPRRAEDQ